MVIVFYNKIDDNKGSVRLIHHQPNLLSESEKAGGILIQEFPFPENREGYYSVPYINLKTFEPFYEYMEIPKTKEQLMQEEIDNLKAQLIELQK